MTATWLVDKSALVRLGTSPDAAAWANRIERGLVGITTVTLLEVGYSARSAAELAKALGSPPLASMPVTYLTPAVEDRALQVQQLLAARGHHRAPSIPGLLVAAAAELNHHAVLHLDKDFDFIAEMTGQRISQLRVN